MGTEQNAREEQQAAIALLTSDAVDSADSIPVATSLNTLQLGLHWFQENAGGADRLFGELIQALPRCGVGCRGLVAGSQRVQTESGGSVKAFAPVSSSIFKRWSGLRTAMGAELECHRPNLVVSHFALYAFPIIRQIRRCRVPLAVHFHGPWASESAAEGAGRIDVRSKRLLERTVYLRAKRLIVLSEAFEKLLIETYGVDPSRVRRIRPGIDTAKYKIGLTRSSARDRLNWPSDRPIVLAVRRLVQRVGLENLIESVEQVRRDVPDVLVLIAGKGPLDAVLRKQITDRGLDHHVRLLGFVPDDDLPAAYTAADLTVVPSQALEGFGLIVIESLAAGTPVLVTPVGGLPEAVRDLSANLVMRGADAASIASDLTAALRGRIRLPSPQACQSFATANYDWAVIARQVRTVYEEAIAR